MAEVQNFRISSAPPTFEALRRQCNSAILKFCEVSPALGRR
jgi:hypothetical protein